MGRIIADYVCETVRMINVAKNKYCLSFDGSLDDFCNESVLWLAKQI